jgi:hypothetical protein
MEKLAGLPLFPEIYKWRAVQPPATIAVVHPCWFFIRDDIVYEYIITMMSVPYI